MVNCLNSFIGIPPDKISLSFDKEIFVWSGLRRLELLPPPWQGGALPDELNPLIFGAFDRNRTSDTGIFSPLLYQLSYKGTKILATRMGLEPNDL